MKMSDLLYVTLIYEDDLSGAVMSQLLKKFPEKYRVHKTYSGNGFGYLKTNIRGFNQASVVNPHFMLADLDNYGCPLELIGDWICFELNPNFIFRIAVREVEAWLLADRKGLARFFNVSVDRIPRDPDSLQDPKNTLIQLAKHSRRRDIREDIVPININAKIGPNYNGRLMEFVFNLWNIEFAMSQSDSLRRAYERLRDFQPR